MFTPRASKSSLWALVTSFSLHFPPMHENNAYYQDPLQHIRGPEAVHGLPVSGHRSRIGIQIHNQRV